MIKRLGKYEQRALLLMLLVLTGVFVFGSSIIFLNERHEDLQQVSRHAEHEMGLVGKLITEALIKRDYVTVERFVDQWALERTDLVDVKIITANGFELAHYTRSQSTEHPLMLTRQIFYGDEGSVRIDLVWDTAPIYQHMSQFLIVLVAIQILFVAALLFFLWWVLRRTLLQPLHGEIQESEQRFRQLTENISEVFWLGSPDWNEIFYVSPAYENKWGLSAQSLYDNPRLWLDAVHPDDREQVVADIPEDPSDIEDYVDFREYRIRTPEGQTSWIKTRAYPIRNPDGKVYRIAGIAEDITERKQAEGDIRNIAAGVSAQIGEAFFQSLVTHLAKLFDAEYTFIGLLDEQRPDMIDTVALCVHGEVVDNLSYELANTPCKHVVDGNCDELQAYPRDIQRLFPDDPMLEEMGAHSYVGAPLADTTGKPIGLIVVMDNKPMENTDRVETILRIFATRAAVEIERLRTEEALRESQKMLQLVLDSIPVRVFWKDINSVYLGCNSHFAKDAGLKSPEQIIGKNDFELGWRDQAELYQSDDQQVMQKGVPKLNYEEPQSGPDGTQFWLQTSKIPLKDLNDNVFGVLGVYGDITERKQAEESLQKSEAHLRTLIQTLPDLVWLKDPDGVYLTCNPKFERFFGAKQSEIVGKTDYDFIDKELADFFREKDKTAMAASRPSLNEEEVTYADDGHRELLETIKTPMYAPDGKLIGVLGVGRDITERKRAEELLQEKEARIRMVVESALDAVIVIDENSIIIEWNPQAENIFGWKSLDAIGRTLMETIIPPQHQEAHRRGMEKVLSTGTGPILNQHKELTALHREGHEFPIELTVSPLHHGDTWIFSAFVRDLTERKQAEERKTSFGQILDGSLNEIYIFDADTLRFIQVNRGARENLGYSIEELQRITPVDLKPEFTPALFAKMIAPLRKHEKEKIQFNTNHQRKDGSLYPVEVHLQFSTFESAPVFVAIILDITERKQAEEALRRSQKMEAIGQLSGGIAHDFNNQLGVVIGYLDFLKNYASNDEKSHQWVDTATKAALRCMDLTRQLLAFSRRQSIEKVVVDLNVALKNIENMITRSVTPEVEVQYFPADDLWQTEIDPGEFQDAILNLVINARDAMPGGGKLLIETTNKYLDAGYVALNPRVEAGDYVQLMLSDTGTGMSAETLEHIFEPFFTTKPEGKGTGLGLAMVYGFVKRYGGHIKVYSEPGMGTTIRMYLPRSTTSEPAVMVNNTHEAKLPTGTESILIVDDEADLLQLANDYLSDLGYQTLRAENAAQAQAILDGSKPIDLLFSDVVMPGGMNGYELAQQAVEMRPGLKVLLTSGYTAKTIANNGLARFSAHLLSKPYRKDDLAQRIRLVLDEVLDEENAT